ncbi:MAG: alkylmercury lyase family protein [Thiobacillus sp.]|uniref:alkylmercury lyase family protein n=1 Tax=Thiobacillus sp. TaxID=924 RepID=UPI002894D217|nr:alkylmercury lyase family protein [Thiobacillus sp.]MDT3706345.1 alkylmercury lyase family protein [Thiobacillus sp.]
MPDTLSQAVQRLNSQLPLKDRHDRLSEPLKALHREVIKSLVMHARPLTRSEVAALVGEGEVDAAIARLGKDDLVVLSKDQRQIVGAYPVTSEATPHEVHVNGQILYAMCALDALAVSPMYEVPVEIRSRCRVSGDTVCITQDGMRIMEARPPTVRVGVRWQMPSGDHAAHSMCMEMVFLRDDATAAAWHGGDLDHHSVFTLDEAIPFGARFFKPLLA